MIYVLVNVSYDHYRFQENVAAFADMGECKEFIAMLPPDQRLPVLEYRVNDEGYKVADKLEREHYWIQTFNQTI